MQKARLVCLDAAPLYPASDSRWAAFTDLADVEVYDRTASVDETVRRCEGASFVLTNKVPFDADTIAKLPELRYIGVLATGYNIIDVEAAHRAGITVTNIPSYSTDSVAQQVFSLLLAITGRVEDYTERVADGEWSRCPDFTFRTRPWYELAGKTMGIVGYGNIGSKVARIASAMGMRVALFTSKAQQELPEGYVKMELDELFEKSDVVSLHCPLTPQTRLMVDARRLALMKHGSILINTARGQLIDESALARALADGHIAAGLDVLSNEPPKADCPLIGAPDCMITPHIAWASVEARNRLFDIALANVKAYVEGAPVNIV